MVMLGEVHHKPTGTVLHAGGSNDELRIRYLAYAPRFCSVVLDGVAGWGIQGYAMQRDIY